MPPKPPAPKKGGPAAPGVVFPLPSRPKPVAVRAVDPMTLPSVAVSGRTFLLTVTPSVAVTAVKPPAAESTSSPGGQEQVSAPAPSVVQVQRSQRVRFQPLVNSQAPAMAIEPGAAVTAADGSVLDVFPSAQASTAGTAVLAAAGPSHLLVASGAGLFAAGSDEYGQLGISGVPPGGSRAPVSTDGVPPGGSRAPGVVPLTHVVVPRMGPLDMGARRHQSAADERDAAQRRRVAEGLGPKPSILDVAAGTRHSLVLVARTQLDAYLDRPGDSTFVPFTQVLACGYARRGAVGVVPKGADAATAVRSGPMTVPRFVAISSLDDAHVDRIWAAHDMSFARGAAGLYAWGTWPRRFFIPSPVVVMNRHRDVSAVACTDDAIYMVCSSGRKVLRWAPEAPVEAGNSGGGGGEAVIESLPDFEATWTDVTRSFIADATPTAVTVTRLSAGAQHVVALLSTGAVVGAGDSGFEQLGRGASRPAQLMPARPMPDPAPAAEDLGEAAVELGKVASASIVSPSGKKGGKADPLASSGRTPASRPVSAQSTADSEVASALPVSAVNVSCGAFCTTVLLSDGSTKSFGRLCYTE